MAAQTSRFCPRCARATLHQRREFGGGWGCLLTILTGGIFLLAWAFIALWDGAAPWICQGCGAARPASVGGRIGGMLASLVCVGAIVGAVALAAAFQYGVGPFRARTPAGTRLYSDPDLRPEIRLSRELAAAIRSLDPGGKMVRSDFVLVTGGVADVDAGPDWADAKVERRRAIVEAITERWREIAFGDPVWVLRGPGGAVVAGWSEESGKAFVGE